MERQTVAEAIACLQQRGESTSVGHIRKFLGHGSPRDISKYQKELLREEPVPPREAAAMVCHVIKTEEEVPPAPTPETPPPTLLDQADLCLRDAIASENAARRALDFASQAEWDHCHARLFQAQRDRAHAQGTLEALRRSTEQLVQGVKDGYVRLRFAEGAQGEAEDAARRAIQDARRTAERTRADLAHMIDQLIQVAGDAVVPPPG